METKKTKVTLATWTSCPVETIYYEWQLSRTAGPVPTPMELNKMIWAERSQLNKLGESTDEYFFTQKHNVGPLEKEVRKIFEEVVTMKIPLAETIDFVFTIDHCSIALREQMVRHRIGHRFGAQLGADIIPDIAESTWWAQTMRVKDMGTYATDGEYLVPESIEGNDKQIKASAIDDHDGERLTVEKFYHGTMRWIEESYRRLVKEGVPIEDARNLLPLGCQHRLTWKLNLSALMHILSKRGCWIAQLGMWEPVIMGMVNELATKVDPFFRKLIAPPCIDGRTDRFKECVFKLENHNRFVGEDPYPPCPLWLHHHAREEAPVTMADLTVKGNPVWRETYERPWSWQGPSPEADTLLARRAAQYGRLWGRNPVTGDPMGVEPNRADAQTHS